MFKEFREFAVKGNVIDMAVGIVIGTAFGSIVNSLVADIIMPPVGLLLGNVDFGNLYAVLKAGTEAAGPYATLADAQAAGAITLNYGIFFNTIITFLIVAFAMFLLIRYLNRIQQAAMTAEEVAPAEPTSKECPYCLTTIALKASRCPNCTSELSMPA
jgi:large conductance mechanosensitive channel